MSSPPRPVAPRRGVRVALLVAGLVVTAAATATGAAPRAQDSTVDGPMTGSVGLTTRGALAAADAPGALDVDAWDFGPSGLSAGGFQNVLSISPFPDEQGRYPLVAGADIAGLHTSADGALTWRAANARAEIGRYRVGSVHHSREQPGEVFACTEAGFAVSVDFGRTWELRSEAPRCDGNGIAEAQVAGNEHPRATGALIAQHGDVLWVGTFRDGVLRSSDGGRTWSASSLAGAQVRALAVSPTDPDVVYAAVKGGGLRVSTNARGALSFSPVGGTPVDVEELSYVGDRLYVAARTAGIFSYDGSWTALSAGLATGSTGSFWQSVTGHVDPATGATVLYAGCARPVGGAAIVKSVDGGASWTSVAAPAQPRLYGTDTPWWAASIPYLRFDGSAAVVSQIAVDPRAPETVYVAGRGGIYKSVDGGAVWTPAGNGLMATVNRSVVADPKVPGRVYVANTDWTFFSSADHGASVTRNGPVGAGGTSFSIALDPSTAAGAPSRVYLSVGDRDDRSRGGIWSNPDPLSGQAWVDEKIGAAAGPHRVQAVGAGQDASGARVLLAAVDGNGLWRKAGGAWQRVSGTGYPFQGVNADVGVFSWVAGTPLVYAADRAAGIYRSRDAGLTWTRLMTATSAAPDSSGFVVVDPTDASRVYVSSSREGAGLWRIDRADSTSTADARPVRIGDFAAPGPVAVLADGSVLVHARAAATGTATLWRSTDAASSAPTFRPVSDAYYESGANRITSLGAGADGFLYTSSFSAGVNVGVPRPAEPDTTSPGVPGAPALSAPAHGVVDLSWAPAADDDRVSSYLLFRDGVQVAVLSGTSYSDAGLQAETSYTYTVEAVDPAGNRSGASPATSITTPAADLAAPSAPAGLTIGEVTRSSVEVRWEAAADDRGVVVYRVYRDGALAGTVAQPTFTDAGLQYGTAYTYAVEAVDASGNVSPLSPPVSASTRPDDLAPAAPGGGTVKSGVPYRAVVSWRATSDVGGSGLAGYHLRRSDLAAPLATLGPLATSYTDTRVRAGTSYTYRLVAFDRAGNSSAVSAGAAVRTATAREKRAPSRPGAPVVVSARAGATRLSWARSRDNVKVIGYHVYRDGRYVGDSSTTAFSDPGTTAGVRYGYSVVAFDSSANLSAASGATSLTAY